MINRDAIIKAINECSDLGIGDTVVIPFETREDRLAAYRQVKKELIIFDEINQKIDQEKVGTVKVKQRFLNKRLCIVLEKIKPISNIYIVEKDHVRKEKV